MGSFDFGTSSFPRDLTIKIFMDVGSEDPKEIIRTVRGCSKHFCELSKSENLWNQIAKRLLSFPLAIDDTNLFLKSHSFDRIVISTSLTSQWTENFTPQFLGKIKVVDHSIELDQKDETDSNNDYGQGDYKGKSFHISVTKESSKQTKVKKPNEKQSNPDLDKDLGLEGKPFSIVYARKEVENFDVRKWDASTKKESSFPFDGKLISCESNSTHLFVNNGQKQFVQHVSTKEKFVIDDPQTDNFYDDQGRYLATLSFSDNKTVIWNLETARVQATIKKTKSPSYLFFTKEHLLTITGKQIEMFEIPTFNKLSTTQQLKGDVLFAQLVDDILVVGFKNCSFVFSIELWDTKEMKSLLTIETDKKFKFGDGCTMQNVCLRDNILVTGFSDGTVILLDLYKKTILKKLKITGLRVSQIWLDSKKHVLTVFGNDKFYRFTETAKHRANITST